MSTIAQPEPLVTVNILSFNRKDDLRVTLTKVFGQDYKNIEVIVVDNASSDGTVEMVKGEFPSVQLIKMEKNIGIAGWNEGFKAARGEYILVLDDDSYPERNTIYRGISAFFESDNVGIIALSIKNTTLQKNETAHFSVNSNSFIGCGAILRKTVLDEIGIYDNLYFLYHNELDLSIRCLNKGYSIKYLNNATVIHKQSLRSRGESVFQPLISELRYYHYYLSYSIFILKCFSPLAAIIYETKWIINRFLVCLFFPYKLAFLKASFKLLSMSFKIFKNRIKISYNIQQSYFGLFNIIDGNYFPKLSKTIIKYKSVNVLIRIKNIISLVIFYVLYYSFPQRHKSNSNNVLFINHGFLGELIISSIIFTNEDNIDPGQSIYFLINEEYKEIFETHKSRINILYVNIDQYKSNLKYRIKFIRLLRQLKFDKSYNLNIKNGLRIRDEIALLSGSCQTYNLVDSYKYSIRPIGISLLEKKYTKTYDYGIKNDFYKRAYLLSDIIGSQISLDTFVPINSFSKNSLDDKLLELKYYDIELPTIVISPISGHQIYDWPLQKFLELIRGICKQYEVNVFILLAPNQADVAFEFYNLNINNLFICHDNYSLPEKIAIVERSNLFIGNDSGFTHIAKAFQKTFIAIIGGAFYEYYFPYEKKINEYYLYDKMDCFGCEMNCIYDKAYCATNVSVEEVMGIINKYIK